MSQHPQVPVDIVVDVLTWLPVKTLIRFRCVCKSWDVLIQNPKFINLHLSRASAEIDRLKVLISLKPNRSLLCGYLDDVDKSLCAGNVAIDDLVIPNYGRLVVGSCNGLLCLLGILRNFLLLNPSTGMCRQVDIHKPLLILMPVWLGILGFGYEHTIDDYKIVQASPLKSDKYPSYGDSVEGLVVIITVGRNTVKKFSCQMPFIPFQVGRQIGGKLHWVVSDVTVAGKERHRLLSFDLKKDEFEEQVLPFPDHKQGGMSSTIRRGPSHVSVLHGQLSVLFRCGVSVLSDTLELWVRDEQGGKESWTKKLSFLPERSLSSFWPNPLCFLKNGGLLMEVSDSLMIYDPKEKKYRMVNQGGIWEWSCAEVYIDSLVSPYHVPFASWTQ